MEIVEFAWSMVAFSRCLSAGCVEVHGMKSSRTRFLARGRCGEILAWLATETTSSRRLYERSSCLGRCSSAQGPSSRLVSVGIGPLVTPVRDTHTWGCCELLRLEVADALRAR